MGIGKATAAGLAAQGARVGITGRDRGRAEAAAAQIARETGNPAVDVFVADLPAQSEVRRLAAEVLAAYPRLDVLVNNVGGTWANRHVTPDGLEHTFALNHLAPFLLTNLLLERLHASAPARVSLSRPAPRRWAGSTSATYRASAGTRASGPTTPRSWPTSCSPTSRPVAWRAPGLPRPCCIPAWCGRRSPRRTRRRSTGC
ncbi:MULTISPECIES: SDR family NAD(P)-dependent oxidoreductase [Kribbella]|uniref:SDR family NAD(P)-dependent oxidoreductase n=1 Tax=Kribbella TaxID=182639 RepID=UPI0018EE81AE|nr:MULTISPECIES: SDR family NAD(P)-dependent oxidoreductase [Kribbella]